MSIDINILVMMIAGAILYRWRGSDYSLPRPVLQAVIALPFALLAYQTWFSIGLWCPILVLTTAALCLGHGQYQDLGTWKGPIKVSSIDFIISRFWGPDFEGRCSYWRDFFGMAVSGLLVTLPAGIITCHPLLALSGALKAVGYAISWRVVKGTWLGEVLTGAVLWGAVAFYLA